MQPTICKWLRLSVYKRLTTDKQAAIIRRHLIKGLIMEIQIVQSSDKMKEDAVKSALKAELYPFDKLEAGQSFTLAIESANLQSLRTIASRKSKNGKRFAVVLHEELSLVEVGRLL